MKVCQNDAYENLASAIIFRAIADYVTVLRQEKNLTKGTPQADCNKKELEVFFASGYFESLTDINGPWLVQETSHIVEDEAAGLREIQPLAFSIF